MYTRSPWTKSIQWSYNVESKIGHGQLQLISIIQNFEHWMSWNAQAVIYTLPAKRFFAYL